MIVDKILKGHELFATLTVDEVNRLSAFSSVKEFNAGETIYEYNQVSSHFYMLMEGKVYLMLPANPPDFCLAISKIEKGELFGISPLLDSPRYTAMAKCYEPTKVLSIEAKPFRKLLQTNCTAGLNIMNQVAHIYYSRYLDVLKRLHDVVSHISLIR
ncbi:cyclic nucleotide-binding domain-containing protein [bacterium]|nr:cyclic nucleotide-binding domain-containing protein [FCB group bacterium]MBL7191706.1 cyclic nucleotide-binding domain-containing protein [bacterium]